eukprot:g892.t1
MLTSTLRQSIRRARPASRHVVKASTTPLPVQAPQKRNFLDTFRKAVNGIPNQVPKNQKHFQSGHGHGAENPTYLKGSNDKMMMYMWSITGTFGFLYACKGGYNMAYGIHKVE